MCPRGATVEHGGAAMARATSVAVSFGEEEYIDLDLSSCGEYEFRWVRRSKPEEMPCRGGRLYKVAPKPRSGTTSKPTGAAEATAGGGCGRRSTATVAPLQHSHVRSTQPAKGSGRRRTAVQAKLQASRAFFRSLFARTSCSDERCHSHHAGIGVPFGSRACQTKSDGGRAAPSAGRIKNVRSISAGPTTLRSSIEQEKLMDEEEEEEHAASSIRQRKSFSGVIRWRQPLPTTAAPAPVSSTRRNSCGSVPAAESSEGLIQGAIAYCKRSQQQRVLLARKSVSDAVLCSS